MMRQFTTSALALLFPFLLNAQSLKNASIDSTITEQKLESTVLPGSRINPTIPNSFFRKNSAYLIPAAMFGYGVFANGNPAMQNINLKIRDGVLAQPNQHILNRFEDKLQYAPAYATAALSLVGVKGNNRFFDQVALYAISNTLMSHTVSKLKTVTSKLRPDGMDRRSFPSGHTATAFSAAEFMRLEYKDASPVYGIAAYTAAAATGALRIYHNKHWFSDVVAGAGIGILSTQVSYFVYPKVKSFVSKKLNFKSKDVHVGPSYQYGAAGVSLVYNPK